MNGLYLSLWDEALQSRREYSKKRGWKGVGVGIDRLIETEDVEIDARR